MSEQKKPRDRVWALTGFNLTVGDINDPYADIRIASPLKPNTTMTGDFIKVTEYAALTAAQERIRELEDRLSNMRKYARHNHSCECIYTDKSCDCGFSKLIQEYDTESKEK